MKGNGQAKIDATKAGEGFFYAIVEVPRDQAKGITALENKEEALVYEMILYLIDFRKHQEH